MVAVAADCAVNGVVARKKYVRNGYSQSLASFVPCTVLSASLTELDFSREFFDSVNLDSDELPSLI